MVRNYRSKNAVVKGARLDQNESMGVVYNYLCQVPAKCQSAPNFDPLSASKIDPSFFSLLGCLSWRCGAFGGTPERQTAVRDLLAAS